MSITVATTRACCGAEQAEWTRRQEARLLPVPYYLLTPTVPQELRGAFLHYPVGIVAVFFTAVASAMKSVCARRKFLGGDTGFIAILHTWTRQTLFHPTSMCSSRPWRSLKAASSSFQQALMPPILNAGASLMGDQL
jgi:hypothetical protein